MQNKTSYETFRLYFTIIMSIFTGFLHIGQFTIFPMESIKFYIWHLMLGLMLVFFYTPLSKKNRDRYILVDWLCIVCALFIGGYTIINYDEFIVRMQMNAMPPLMFWFSIVMSALVIEATRRVLGWSLPIIAVISVLYALYGENLPGLLGHRGYSIKRVMAVIFSDQGLYGTAIGVSASNVFLFLLFAALLSASGADKIFQDVAIALTGRKRGGPAKMAVVASALFGSISGSAVANVVSTGSFTIPLMKRQGYSSHFAGAVEAVASTGGQIMPPIMGAAAFILAEISGTPYARVALAALLPALMYYITVFKMVDLESVKHNLKGISAEDMPDLKLALKSSFKLFIPLIVLLYLLLVEQTTPMRAAIWSMVAIVACGVLDKNDRLTWRKLLEGVIQGSRSLPQVVAACACAGIVTGMFALTGLGLKFSDFIVQLGGQSIIFSLLLSMLVCIILGMGLPTTASYIICAIAMAPALTKLGLPNLAAHMFLMYFACISAITPPVAVASFAAAGIAKDNPMRVSFTAVKLGVAGFVLPFVFTLNPDFINPGLNLTTLFTYLSAFVVCISTAVLIQGYVEQRITIVERILYFGVIVTAIQSSILLTMIGIFMFLVLYGARKLQYRRSVGLSSGSVQSQAGV